MYDELVDMNLCHKDVNINVPFKVFKTTDFNLFGFILCLSAAATGGLRWTLSQVLCQKKELGLENPIDSLFHLQPVMVLAMAPLLIS